MQPYRKKESSLPSVMMIIAACIAAVLIYYVGFSGSSSHPVKKAESDASETGDAAKESVSLPEAAVDVKPSQLNAIKIEAVGTYSFRIEREAVGSVAYHEKEADGTVPADSKAHDSTTKFVVANVPESSSPLIRAGQSAEVKMAVFPDRVFIGKVSTVGVTIYDSGGNPAIDPSTHRIAVRCEIADPKNELYPGMLATVAIQVEKPTQSVAIPMNGVVRKGDGTMTVWVTKDRKRFEERTVKVGLQQDGYDQITDGLRPGELVATDGALFIDNALTATPE